MSSILNTQKKILNQEELKSFWQEFLTKIGERCILLLSGDVGAGKTTSTQMIADILGMKNVQSPSFAIHLAYQNAQGKTLDHVDLYRLKDDEDLESSGFWDLFATDEGLVIIEWAQRLNFEYLPLNWQRLEVKIEKTAVDGERILTIKNLD
jgi:tRNA threonylcarbamoyladenosine biosynthesis protein TsaE